jgi:CubicO group peptidase (beta-lactamase class C family)
MVQLQQIGDVRYPTEVDATRISEAGLAQLHDGMERHVTTGKMPGLITLVQLGGEPQVDVIGTPSFDDPSPLQRDAIFRIASLTKPITAAVAMMLVDDGVLNVDDSVEDYLPELASRRVLRSIDAELDDTVAAERPITVDDLLTFRLGFGVVMVPPDTYPIQTAEREMQLQTLGPPWPPTPHTPDEWMHHFGSLPLMHQPGESWMYNTGSQVLGVLIERAAGKPLETFMRERLFDPLGMSDTGFGVRPDQLDRLTTAYAPDSSSGEINLLDDPTDSYWADPPSMPDGAGGLVSTIDDYWAFVSMLLDGGTVRGGAAGDERVLSERSIDLMVADHLTEAQRSATEPFTGQHSSWGLGMGVPASSNADRGVPHGFGWTGGTGTVWYTDPTTGFTGILFTQRAMTSPEPPEAMIDFWRLAYSTLSR